MLLVDDNAQVRRLQGLLLERDGFDVRTAGSVAEAVEAATEPRPHLVLTDWNLPDGSGTDLRRQCGDGPIYVALTGDATTRRASEEAGFVRHLLKPMKREALTNVLRELLTKRG